MKLFKNGTSIRYEKYLLLTNNIFSNFFNYKHSGNKSAEKRNDSK